MLLRHVGHHFFHVGAATTPGDAVALTTHRRTAHTVTPLVNEVSRIPHGVSVTDPTITAGLDVIAARAEVFAAAAL